MLSKEQIDRLDELAESVKGWGSCNSNDGENLAAFYAAANPQAISELIAMLREAQKDSARIDAFDKYCTAYGFQDIHEGNRWTIEGPFATFRKAIDESMDYDAAMQRDCDGAQHAGKAQPKPLTCNDLEKGKLYYIHGNGLCEYVGLDRYMGETTCQFRKIEYGQHSRDFYYSRIDEVPTTVFVKKEDAEGGE